MGKHERNGRLGLVLASITLAVGLLFSGQHARAGKPNGQGDQAIPAPTDAPLAAAIATATTPASGAVLWSDTLSDPNTGSLPKSSSQPANYEQGYVSGEYQLAKVSPSYDGGCGVTVPGVYTDVTVSVDFHLDTRRDSNAGQNVRLQCRHQTVAVNGKSTFPTYAASFLPATGQGRARLQPKRWEPNRGALRSPVHERLAHGFGETPR